MSLHSSGRNRRIALPLLVPAGRYQRLGLAVVLLASHLICLQAKADGADSVQVLKVSEVKPAPKRQHVEAQSPTPANGPIRFQNVVVVKVDGLDKYLSDSKADIHSLILFINHRPLPGLTARRLATSGDDKDRIEFDLTRAANVSESDLKILHATWDSLMGAPAPYPGYARYVDVTVGLKDQPFESTAQPVNLIVIPEFLGWGGIGAVVILAITVLLVSLAVGSDLLRDPGPPLPKLDAAGNPVVDSQNKPQFERKPYSLARVQMAIWFWTIIVSYVFIWVVIGETGSLTGQVLAILGISTLTFFGSRAMDVRNENANQQTARQLNDSLAAKKRELADLDSQILTAPDTQKPALQTQREQKQKQLQDLVQQIADFEALTPANRISTTFLEDILSDANGVNFHRFQIFAWTLVVVVVFAENVWRNLNMPTLNDYLLTLMGMSSATYVAGKQSESNLRQIS